MNRRGNMNGVSFGKKVKELRKKSGIPSKELATKVGKAVTYVSQLERGLIKKPDFDTCFKLLKELGSPEDKIEDILSYYGIVSPQREQQELEWATKQAEEAWNFDWMEQSKQKLMHSNDQLHSKFNLLIEKDLSKAEKLINNIESLTKSKDKFDFLCTLFEYDYSVMETDDRKELTDIISRYILSKYKIEEYEEWVKKGDNE